VGDSPKPAPPNLGAALNTDLYELTMAAGYFEAGKAQDSATFELFVRRLPWNRNFVLAAGLAIFSFGRRIRQPCRIFADPMITCSGPIKM